MLKKHIYAILVISLILVVTINVIQKAEIPIQNAFASSGWLEGWSYRKAHDICGSSAGSQTNYQVIVKVHYSSGVDDGENVYLDGKCKTDFADIRFTNLATAQLDYWIEKKTDGVSALFWVEVDYILVYPENVTIYPSVIICNSSCSCSLNL